MHIGRGLIGVVKFKGVEKGISVTMALDEDEKTIYHMCSKEIKDEKEIGVNLFKNAKYYEKEEKENTKWNIQSVKPFPFKVDDENDNLLMRVEQTMANGKLFKAEFRFMPL